MNKVIVIGIIVAIIIAGVIGVVSLSNVQNTDEQSLEIIEPESEVISVPENTGRNLSVELSEDIGLTSP
jgi:hypothetical protein